jgi:hypothetical protein
MLYDRTKRTVTTTYKGRDKVRHLRTIRPEVMWDWIKSGRVHRGMFIDYLEERTADEESPDA